MSKLKSKFKFLKNKPLMIKLGILAGLVVVDAICMTAFAGASQGIAVSTIDKSVNSSTSAVATILSDVSLLAGVGFVMASFFKFHQHKLNPTQVPISQGVTLLLIGAGLCLFPTLIPTATHAVFGSKATVNQIGGSGIAKIIGKASG